jgi:CBS domain containing-hemolysin-like protein
VYRGTIDNVIGLLHTKRAAVQLLEQGRLTHLPRMLQPLQGVPETLRADQLLQFFRKHRTVIALVIDEFGGTAGLVTIQDVLEELLGEMADEFRAAEETPARLPDGRVRLPGRMRKDDAAPLVGTHWRGESETVGGLVVETLGYLPAQGERLTLDDVLLEVERVQDRSVASVLATPRQPTLRDGDEEHHHHG